VLLGAKWTAAAPLVRILTWPCVFSVFSLVFTTVMTTTGHLRRNFWANVVASVVKVAAMTGIVSVTHDLTTIAMVAVGVVTAESATFTLLLAFAERVDVRGPLASIARAAVAGAIALFAGSLLPASFTTGGGPVVDAIVHGAVVAAVVFVAFTAAAYVLWRVTGQVAGPETRLAGLARELAAPLLRHRRLQAILALR